MTSKTRWTALALGILGCGCGSNGLQGFDAPVRDAEPDTRSLRDAGLDTRSPEPNDANSPPKLGDLPDGYTPPASSGEPASSLSLEQTWFISSASTRALIDFRADPPKVECETAKTTSNGFEGTAVFTDPKTGDLLLYTDGRTVFNGRTRQRLDNGMDLNGDASASEPALITPRNDGSGSHFYVFTNTSNADKRSESDRGQISYSEVDLSMGPNGTVTAKNLTLFDGNPGEALDVVPHSNGKDFWVLTYGGASTIRAHLVSATGPSLAPVQSALPFLGKVFRGAINHTLDYNTLVLALHREASSSGLLATATMDRTSGAVTGVVQHVSGAVGYNAAFSADGSKLYYAMGRQGFDGQAHQFDLKTRTDTLLGGTAMAAPKLAPDGKLYWASFGSSTLGVVEHPNAAGIAAGFVPNGLHLKGCMSGYGVPNQTASYLEYLPTAPK